MAILMLKSIGLNVKRNIKQDIKNYINQTRRFNSNESLYT